MTDFDVIRNRIGSAAYYYIKALLDEIDSLRAQVASLTEESQTIPVAVDNDPPELVWCGLEQVPARHFEFYTHTRKTTPWHSDDCPECAAEPGIHDRRGQEALELTLELWRPGDEDE